MATKDPVKKENAMLRYLLALVAGLLLPALCSAQCLTTLPPNPPFVPPVQYPPDGLAAGTFWYGTDALWTALRVDGTWKESPESKGKGYFEKLVFWRRGFDWRKEIKPKLIVTGKRLDGDAPSIAEAHASAVFVTDKPGYMPPGMMTGIDLPTAGCWEITAHYGGHTLTFIISVELEH
jgi:hypothetical protein